MITLKRIIIWVITLVFAATFIFSGIQIINYINNAKENEDIAKEIAEEISEEISDKISGNNAEDDKKSVDFSSLKAMNSDTVGYLKVNGTNVESAVVQAKDNSYYLSHNFKKNYNKAGWIFADYRNQFDGTDKNIVIYGHNMKNGSMFSSLKNILTANWQEQEEKKPRPGGHKENRMRAYKGTLWIISLGMCTFIFVYLYMGLVSWLMSPET